MSAKYHLTTDLKEARQMVDVFEDYIRSEQVYGSTGGMFGSNAPALTVGSLLMRLRRLDHLREHLKRKQGAELDAIIEKHDAVQVAWRVHYEEKMIKEAHSRLDAMRTFFDECRDNPRLCRNIYRPEALRRTIVRELMLEMAELSIESEDLEKKTREVDGKLRGVVQESEFIWDGLLQQVYPSETFWWLYALPVETDEKAAP